MLAMRLARLGVGLRSVPWAAVVTSMLVGVVSWFEYGEEERRSEAQRRWDRRQCRTMGKRGGGVGGGREDDCQYLPVRCMCGPPSAATISGVALELMGGKRLTGKVL